jgi:hypothetical protein
MPAAEVAAARSWARVLLGLTGVLLAVLGAAALALVPLLLPALAAGAGAASMLAAAALGLRAGFVELPPGAFGAVLPAPASPACPSACTAALGLRPLFLGWLLLVASGVLAAAAPRSSALPGDPGLADAAAATAVRACCHHPSCCCCIRVWPHALCTAPAAGQALLVLHAWRRTMHGRDRAAVCMPSMAPCPGCMGLHGQAEWGFRKFAAVTLLHDGDHNAKASKCRGVPLRNVPLATCEVLQLRSLNSCMQ